MFGLEDKNKQKEAGDEPIKSSPIFPQRCPKCSHGRFDRNNDIFQKSSLIHQIFGQLCKTISHQDHSK